MEIEERRIRNKIRDTPCSEVEREMKERKIHEKNFFIFFVLIIKGKSLGNFIISTGN